MARIKPIGLKNEGATDETHDSLTLGTDIIDADYVKLNPDENNLITRLADGFYVAPFRCCYNYNSHVYPINETENFIVNPPIVNSGRLLGVQELESYQVNGISVTSMALTKIWGEVENTPDEESYQVNGISVTSMALTKIWGEVENTPDEESYQVNGISVTSMALTKIWDEVEYIPDEESYQVNGISVTSMSLSTVRT